MRIFKDTFAKQAKNPIPEKRVMKNEEAATGINNLEQEYVFYAKLDDQRYLKDATSVEDQEQWEIRIDKKEDTFSACRMRIRKTSYPNEPARAVEYTYTVKTKNTKGGEDEVTTPSSADTFEAFKRASARGMRKRRYVLPINGYKAVWEIDTYEKDGKPQPWCKIDFELVKGDSEVVPNLPTGFSSILEGNDSKEETQTAIRKLYDDVFLLENEFLSVNPAI